MDCGIKNEEMDESPNGTVTFTAYPVNPNHAEYFEAVAYGAGGGIMTSGRIIWGEFHVQIQMKGSNITAFIYQSDRESAQAEEFATLDAFFERVAELYSLNGIKIHTHNIAIIILHISSFSDGAFDDFPHSS
jgi:hypothetical protein